MSKTPSSVKLGRSTIHSPLPQGLENDCTKCASILERFIKGNNKIDATLIPPNIVAKAKGIAVITFLKAGFVWSGRLGSGLVVARLPDGRWSAPSAIGSGGAGFGAQIGASLTDCVFILNTESAVKAFSHTGNLTFGGNMSVCAGPTGRSLEGAGTIANIAPIYSYSKSKGLFAGLSLEGSVIITRDDANKTLYGKKVTAKQLLTGEVDPPVQAEELYRVLNYRFGNMGTGIAVPHPVSTRTHISQTSASPASAASRASSISLANQSSASINQYSPASRSNSVTSVPPAYGSVSGGFTPSIPTTKRPTPQAPRPKQDIAIAQYDFTGERASDLSFRKGDRINVIQRKGENEWWKGELNGITGDFPGNYVA